MVGLGGLGIDSGSIGEGLRRRFLEVSEDSRADSLACLWSAS